MAVKYAFGFAVVAAGFFVYAASGNYAVNGRVSSWFMVGGYGLYSLGELLVSGLGLLGMRERAERLGGELQLHSEPGQGTEVAVTVPLA